MKNFISQGIIKEITDSKIAGRLLSMGVLPGEHLCVWRKALFGGAYYVQVGHQFLALRESELKHIQFN